MKNSLFRLSGTVRTAFVLVASFGLLAAGVPTPARAANLILQGATTANCTYSAASMDASGNLTVTTATSCGILPPADTLAFSSVPTTVAVNGTVNVTVTRTNPVGATIQGTVTAAPCTVSNGGIAGFSGTATSTTLQITAPAAATTCPVTLAAGTGANLGTPNTFNLSVTAVSPDVVAFGTPLSALLTNGSGTITVTRAGANSTGGVTATVSATGGCTVSGAGAVSFPTTSTAPVSLTVTAPAAAATCTVTLAAGTGATLGTPNSFNIGVTAPPPTTPGCSTTATSTIDVQGLTRVTVPLTGGTSTALKFFSPGYWKTQGGLSSVQNVNYPIPPNIQVNVSQCPGDFNAVSDACYQYNPNGENTTVQWVAGSGMFWYCILDPTKTYYLNVRTLAPGSYGVAFDM